MMRITVASICMRAGPNNGLLVAANMVYAAQYVQWTMAVANEMPAK